MHDTAEPGESAAAAIDEHCAECAELRARLAAVFAPLCAATGGGMPHAARVRLRRFLAARIRGS